MVWMKKKGEQSIGVTIAIVIGVIVLVLLVFGLTDVWGLFRGETGVITDSNSNIDDLIDACDLRCQGEDMYAYCIESRDIELEGDVIAKGSCYAFAEELFSYGFNSCSRVSCVDDNAILKDSSGAEIAGSDFQDIYELETSEE